MDLNKVALKNLPGIDKLLCTPEIKDLISLYGQNLVKHICRECITDIRADIINGKPIPSEENIFYSIQERTKKIGSKSLIPVINASGIILHTNLGRAPLGEHLVKNLSEILLGYNNLEFDLEKGERGQRTIHASEILKFLTRAEDVLVVNNNAAL